MRRLARAVDARFLCETADPTVRADPEDARRIVELYNDQLRRDGWEVYERGEISGRPEIDRQIEEIRLRVREARNEKQYQSIGHLYREVLITVAQTIYERDLHPTLDGVPAGTTDAKRMLDAYFAVELAGQGYADARKHARAAFDIANGLQHDRKASFRDAVLCAEAALSVVRIVAIVSGRRERIELD